MFRHVQPLQNGRIRLPGKTSAPDDPGRSNPARRPTHVSDRPEAKKRGGARGPTGFDASANCNAELLETCRLPEPAPTALQCNH